MARTPCPQRQFTLPEALALLDRTPLTLRSLLDGLDEPWLDSREAPGTWSPREVVAHLIEGEKSDWVPRTHWILECGTSKPFPAFDRQAHLQGDGPAPIEELLDELADRRGENLEVMRGIAVADLDRRGVHPALGEVSLHNLLATWAVHDMGHLAQIARVLASRYRADCGPWDHPDYLGILHWRRAP